MPPKEKITKQDILKASLELVRNGGMAAVNARAIAKSLRCSTQPIFRFYDTMEALKADVLGAINAYYNAFFDERIKRADVTPYKATGLAYIHFAKEEKEFFKILFMRDRTGETIQENDHSLDIAVQRIMSATGFDYDTARRFHIEMWIFVHGIATMAATSYLELDDGFISDAMLHAYQGVSGLYIKEGRGESR